MNEIDISAIVQKYSRILTNFNWIFDKQNGAACHHFATVNIEEPKKIIKISWRTR